MAWFANLDDLSAIESPVKSKLPTMNYLSSWRVHLYNKIDSDPCEISETSALKLRSLSSLVIASLMMLYCLFIEYRFVDSQFVHTLNTKTLYSWFTKSQTLKVAGTLSPMQLLMMTSCSGNIRLLELAAPAHCWPSLFTASNEYEQKPWRTSARGYFSLI